MNLNSNFKSRRDSMIWAAGYIDGRGSFTIITPPRSKPYVQFRVRSTVNDQGIIRLAEILDRDTYKNKKGIGLNILGDALHDFMREVWPYLTVDRKKAYADLRKILNPQASSETATTKGQGYGLEERANR